MFRQQLRTALVPRCGSVFRRIGLGTVLPVGLILLAGCGVGAPTPNRPARNSAPAPRTASATAKLVSEDAAAEFAEKFHQALTGRDLRRASTLIDWDAILDKAWQGLGASKQTMGDFRKGFLATLEQGGTLLTEVVSRLDHNGELTLLRIRERDGRRTVLFRLLQEPGVSYLEFALEERPGGAVRATDIFLSQSAEWCSEGIRRFCLPLAAQADRSLIDRLAGREQLMIKHLSSVQKMTNALTERRWRDTIDAYHALPEGLREHKNLLLLRCRAAVELGDDELYQQAIEALQRFHPYDPCLAFVNLDYYFLKADYLRALAVIDLMDAEIGGDLYLDVLRSELHSLSGDYAAAERAALKAVEADELMLSAYTSLILNAARHQKFADAVKWLEELQRSHEVNPEYIRTVADYESFAKSPEFAAWANRQRSTNP